MLQSLDSTGIKTPSTELLLFIPTEEKNPFAGMAQCYTTCFSIQILSLTFIPFSFFFFSVHTYFKDYFQ